MADQPVTREKLINADIDVENLGKAVNEKGVVNPRYGNSYPTLPSAIQAVIETGGFEPFETEVDLLASTPILEKKAAKALDTKKIWLYVNGAWKDTGLSELDQAKNYTNDHVSELYSSDNFKAITPIVIDGYAVNNDPQKSNILSPGTGRAAIKLDTSIIKKFKISGSINRPNWQWVFEKSNGSKIVSFLFGDGILNIPSDVIYAYRTKSLDGVSENPSMLIQAEKLEKPFVSLITEQVDDMIEMDYLTNKAEAVTSEIVGYAANFDSSQTILSPGAGRKSIKVDVLGLSQIIISGSKANPDWRWVFQKSNGTKIATDYFFNGILNIPSDVIYAYRTTELNGVSENSSMRIEVTKDNGLAYTLNQNASDINEITEVALGEQYIEPTINLKEGASVDTISPTTYLTSGAGRSYMTLNVSGYEALKVEGANDFYWGWVWIFKLSNGAKFISNFSGNGEFKIPEGAIEAYRTYRVDSNSRLENPNIKISLKSKKTTNIPKQIQVERNRINTKNLIKVMTLAFEQGRTLKISQFIGATPHDQIENALKFIKKRGWGILDMESGVWLRNSAMLLPSNCWIYLNQAEIKLADGVFDNLMRNDGIVPNPNPYEGALELRENSNIRIFGAGRTISFVSGPDVPYSAPHPIKGGEPIPWVGDYFGWRTLTILLANVKDYKLHDFGMRKTTCWAIAQEHGCEDFDIFNLHFDTRLKNGDGVHFNQGCKNGRVDGMYGYTLDDTVAFTAVPEFQFISQYPSTNDTYIYPLLVGGYKDRGFGLDIENIQVTNVRARGAHHGVRVLASGGGRCRHISIDGVEDVGGVYGVALVLISSGYGTIAQMGDISGITVNDIKSNQTAIPLKLAHSIKDSSFNFIRQHNSSGVLYDNPATFENTEITNAEFVF